MMLHDVGQMQIVAAAKACNMGYKEIYEMIEELEAYATEVANEQRFKENHAFAKALIRILSLNTNDRWELLNYFAHSHGMELYK